MLIIHDVQLSSIYIENHWLYYVHGVGYKLLFMFMFIFKTFFYVISWTCIGFYDW
jgi:hypothetical protein